MHVLCNNGNLEKENCPTMVLKYAKNGETWHEPPYAKAEIAAEKRFDAVNEFRGQLADHPEHVLVDSFERWIGVYHEV